uniref:EGF-like calcium-binding domain-containing protein n=1 Tax=Romanomermis culicivorax TaxID=13658 RepID=A0A915L714_ROMCU
MGEITITPKCYKKNMKKKTGCAGRQREHMKVNQCALENSNFQILCLEVGTDCVEINECEEPANQGNNFCTMRRAICVDDLRGFHCRCPENLERTGTENDFVCM